MIYFCRSIFNFILLSLLNILSSLLNTLSSLLNTLSTFFWPSQKSFTYFHVGLTSARFSVRCTTKIGFYRIAVYKKVSSIFLTPHSDQNKSFFYRIILLRLSSPHLWYNWWPSSWVVLVLGVFRIRIRGSPNKISSIVRGIWFHILTKF